MYKWEIANHEPKKKVGEEKERAKLEEDVGAMLILLVLHYMAVTNIPGEQVWQRKNV
jgi:hypothetical protein